ncbi:gluconate 2-dehydrogenase subunit 3 family protein [Lentibacillus cibarius]|uniref:Gluconate 2-dehydrogenase subunit 3 family protein n=1 Tax=Lentibacillus cibarius TaxID=2583219 RepID=A0A549YJ89_9BACI|nr:gluconate 2-dehydrogenase subunit 3 family protein [Lentibacillus cibarius]TRM11953.1 gluconate 2-dehydrogenase subunit 3 family protein [Lentibacillus cibarius]
MTDKRSDDDKNLDEDGLSRRRFIKNTGMVAGGVVGGSLLGGLLTSQFQTNEETKTDKKQETSSDLQDARMFFNQNDFKVLQAATERIFPEDDNGPGAIGLGVPYFIDKQLAGSWGTNAKDYRERPFLKFNQVENMQQKDSENLPPNPQGAQGEDQKTNTENQRHQSRLNRREIFLNGLRKMNQLSQERFNTTFDEASEEQQIEILQDFESGKVKLKGVAAENFFILLRVATLEGAYSDPLYGGNKNMDGWKMKEFPGAQPAYTNKISQDEFAKIKPISLTDYQG